MNLAYFLYANTYSGELKVTSIAIGGYDQIWM